MAASAKMSFNYYQNGKHGTLPQNTANDMEVTQDMHLKMSKKIAQLTKVGEMILNVLILVDSFEFESQARMFRM